MNRNRCKIFFAFYTKIWQDTKCVFCICIRRAGLTQDPILRQIAGFSPQKLPPLASWNPQRISPFPLRICANGDWIHEGTKMTRQSLIKLFASVLWAEYQNDTLIHYLKTPSDLYQITVEESPLFVNRVEYIEGVVVFLTTTDDMVVLSDVHMPFFRCFAAQMRPYILVRDNLVAKILRNAFYDLVNMGELIEQDGRVCLVITSGGVQYTLCDMQEAPCVGS